MNGQQNSQKTYIFTERTSLHMSIPKQTDKYTEKMPMKLWNINHNNSMMLFSYKASQLISLIADNNAISWPCRPFQITDHIVLIQIVSPQHGPVVSRIIVGVRVQLQKVAENFVGANANQQIVERWRKGQ